MSHQWNLTWWPWNLFSERYTAKHELCGCSMHGWKRNQVCWGGDYVCQMARLCEWRAGRDPKGSETVFNTKTCPKIKRQPEWKAGREIKTQTMAGHHALFFWSQMFNGISLFVVHVYIALEGMLCLLLDIVQIALLSSLLLKRVLFALEQNAICRKITSIPTMLAFFAFSVK